MPLTFCLSGENDCCNSSAVNANLTQGETINYQWAFKNPDGTPMNLTGFYFQIGINFPVAVFYNSNGNGLTINPSAGTLSWNVSDTVTNNYPIGEYQYQFFGQDSGGNRTMDFSGIFIINQSFTPLSA